LIGRPTGARQSRRVFPLDEVDDAPPPPAHNGMAYWFKVSAREDGSFTVTNARNGFAKTYAAMGR